MAEMPGPDVQTGAQAQVALARTDARAFRVIRVRVVADKTAVDALVPQLGRHVTPRRVLHERLRHAQLKRLLREVEVDRGTRYDAGNLIAGFCRCSAKSGGCISLYQIHASALQQRTAETRL